MFGATARRSLISVSRGGFPAQASLPLNMAQKRRGSALPASYKEDLSKGRTYRYEDSLPHLPVPTLDATAKRYLKSVHPLLSETDYKKTQKAVEDFVAGPGQTLQKRLEERAANPKIKNWLSEWWNSGAYMAYRDPVCPYVSYFYSHRDDRKRRDQAKRAAAISYAVLDFKKQLDEGALEIESAKGIPWAMSSYKWMFNACRIPAKPEDYSQKYDYKQNPYIVVIRKNRFWKLFHEHEGVQLSCAELKSQLEKILSADAEVANFIGPGILTTENRDTWADARDRLIKTPENLAALETIQAASFVLCLDQGSPVTLRERALQYFAGGQSIDAGNRFYDKPLQFIVNSNGTSGFNGEHSMMDGTPTHRLNDAAMAMIAGEKLDFDDSKQTRSLPAPTPIEWKLNGATLADISLAQTHHSTVIASHELVVEAFQGYGKGFIKKAKCSPDSYIQMMLQLAYFYMHGVSRPTYESAATRVFAEGRTETCRSVSDESVAWCKAMSHPLSTSTECNELFRKALAAQGEYIASASDGRGVDRHLFGLKKCLKPGEDVPEIFKDPAFSYSSSWYISSSQLSSEYYNGYGWSQVIDDGFGCAYMINENSINFNIVSKQKGSEKLAFYINTAAQDMRDMLLPTIQDKPKL